MSTKTIIFSGGGSGGHVIPALTLIKEINKLDKDIRVRYIGSYSGIESRLVAQKGIPYKGILTGKLRRYISIQNIVDLFKVLIGTLQAFFYLLKFNSKDTIIFVTGGFVCVPVAIGAFLTRKTLYIHEQTSRVGLANKICSKFAKKVFVSFEDSLKLFSSHKVELSGYPLRASLYQRSVEQVVIEGTKINDIKKPILFITGGGNGSGLLNDLIKKNLKLLSRDFFVIHQVGKSFIDEFKKLRSESYLPLEFLGDEMIDIFKLSKVILSRAGAGTVCELMALQKKSIFIPLKIAQKNEQYHNAMSAQKLLGSEVIEEDELSDDVLLSKIQKFEIISDTEKTSTVPNGTEYILEKLRSFFKIN